MLNLNQLSGNFQIRRKFAIERFDKNKDSLSDLGLNSLMDVNYETDREGRLKYWYLAYI